MDTKPIKTIFVRTLYIMVILAVVLSVTGNVRAENAGPQIGLIVNVGGVDDNSFNSMAYQGLLLAIDDIGITPSVYEPVDENEFDVKLEECAEDQNELCIAVGFNFGIGLANAAREHPDTLWAIVDYTYPDCWEGAEEGIDCGSFTELPNVRGLSFDEKQAGYLAGVLAGGMTSSNVVGAVGGMEIPPVVAFVEGYRNGAQCTNHAVNVLTAYTGIFNDQELGAITADDMIGQGADVIFGPAGQTGDGAILYSAQNGKWAIGVDDDRYLTAFGGGTVPGADKLLSSAMKRVDVAVYYTIADYVAGNFSSGTVLYDLAAGGVGLAPFHDADESIPQSVREHLDAAVQGILDGTLDINNPCNPFIAVSITEHWFWVNNFMPETLVTFSIYDDQGDIEPILKFSIPTDEMGNRTIDGWQHIWDPEPGDYIVATDGLITKDLVLEYLTLDVFDPGEDIISGTAMLGREVDIGMGNAETEYWIRVSADDPIGFEIGRWTANLREVGFDITEDMWAGAHVNDEDGDVTAAHNSGPPEPPAWFTVFPEWDAIEAWNFPIGAEVHLAIYEDPDDLPVYEQNEPVTFTPWDSWELWTWFDLSGTYDVKPGDIVTLSYGETVRTHVVQNLAVSKVNPEDDLVKGTSDPGAEIYVWPHATGQEEFLAANPKGKWSVDFTGIYDLMPGDGGRARIWGENGNATEVDWYIPKSRIVASITEDWFYLQEFSPNKTLKFTIFDAVGEKPIWNGEATTDDSGFAWIDSDGRWDLEPGNYLVVKDGRNSKDLVIEGFTFDVFDLANGHLEGTAPEPFGRTVWVGVGFEEDGWSMEIPTDPIDGWWAADFDTPVPSNYQWVAAQIFDEDGDASELRPALVVNLWVAAYTYDFSDESLVDGTYSYHFEFEWSDPESGSWSGQDGDFVISSAAELYDGYVLLRGPSELRGVTDQEELSCEEVGEINPNQSMRFLIGWLPDYGMTYPEAQTYFESLTGRVFWGENESMSGDLVQHEIMPFSFDALDAWFNYVCTFTQPE